MKIFLMLCVVVALSGVFPGFSFGDEYLAGDQSGIDANSAYRWLGHDFVFCFVTDDGRISNQAWADTARVMGFRFTIAVNAQRTGETYLSPQNMADLAADGFEIANHSLSHGFNGVPEDCPSPPRGSMMAYFLCDDMDPEESMAYFQSEIDRDSLATIAGIPANEVRSFAYPRHKHCKAIIDSLRSEGYRGARMGGKWDYSVNSYGDFETVPANSWEGGISLYRVPVGASSTGLFGDHSANPPVHKSYEDFLAYAQPRIDEARTEGGIFVLFDHHLGDDNDSLGDVNYGSGGVTKEDLAWMVDLVRANGGVVMTFTDAVEYYRSRTVMTDLDGDLVWAPPVAGVPTMVAGHLMGNYPNPFNPRTRILWEMPEAGRAIIRILDVRGRQVRMLAAQDYLAGEHFLDWNGVDDLGHQMSAGVYLAQVETQNWSDITKMTLLK